MPRVATGINFSVSQSLPLSNTKLQEGNCSNLTDLVFMSRMSPKPVGILRGLLKTSLQPSVISAESHLHQLAVTSVTKSSNLEVSGKSRQYGLFSLYEPPDGPSSSDENCPVDIIALHKIDGTPFKTWTHTEVDSGGKKTDTFWLRDFLPDVFPGARIYTYGYNAKIIFSKGTGNIIDFASTLLELILDKRTGREQQRRPIVFICHSMGGLVVKQVSSHGVPPHKDCTENSNFIQALAIAEGNDRYGDIRAATSAILFIATPHRGSESAALLANVASLANGSLAALGIPRLKGRIRSELVEPLGWDSGVLKKIAKDFKPLTTGSIKLYSFIEDLVTAPLEHRVSNSTTNILVDHN
jgi:hypothetical protein